MTNTAQSHRERTAGWFPVDTALVVGYVAFMSVLLLGSSSPVAVLVAMPLLFFLPGYALLSVAFPRGRAPSDVADAVGHPAAADDARPLSWPGLTAGIASGRLGWRARAALSLGTSVSLLPLLALVLAAAGIGYDTVAVVGSLDLFTVTAMVLGQVRRWRLPRHEQYVVPFRQWWQELTSAFDTATPGDSLVNLVLVVAVVAAMSGVTYALIVPQQGETYTEVALLTDEGGDLVAGNYTREFVRGEPSSLVVSVENHEGRPTTYTLVGQLERVRAADGTLTVLSREEVDRVQVTLGDGETRYLNRTVTPTMLGTELRLSYYLYEGDPPTVVGPGTADQHLYLWISVGTPGTTGTVESDRSAPNRTAWGDGPADLETSA